MDINKIKMMAKRMRKSALEMAFLAGANSSHLGPGLSIIDIVATLYGGIMKYDINNPEWNERDRFILSKGHGVLGYYTALAEYGFISHEDLLTFEKSGGYLAGHPVMNREKGIEFSTGSLGMGLSLGIGVAIAGIKRNFNYTVYVLMGDGECNEGSVWEAVMSAAQYGLYNLVIIIDKNEFQLGGSNFSIMNLGDVVEKFNASGWIAYETNGHDIQSLYDIINKPRTLPLCIVANTIKGKGVSFMENNNAWHHSILTKEQYEQAIIEIEANYDN